MEEMLTFLDRAEITEEDYKDFLVDDEDDDEDSYKKFKEYLKEHPNTDPELESDF